MSDVYRAARERAAYADRRDRVRFAFTGAQAATTLNGLLTNDIAAVHPGTGCYAAALTGACKPALDACNASL